MTTSNNAKLRKKTRHKKYKVNTDKQKQEQVRACRSRGNSDNTETLKNTN